MTQTSENAHPPTQFITLPEETKSWEVYVASAIGGVLLYFAEMIRNGADSMMVRLERVLRPFVPADLGLEAEHAVLIALILLGAALCFVHSPKTRIDAFVRGASVITLIASLNIGPMIPEDPNSAERGPLAAHAAPVSPSRAVSTCLPRTYGLLGLGTAINGDLVGCWVTPPASAPLDIDCDEMAEVAGRRFCVMQGVEAVMFAPGEQTAWVEMQ